MRISIETTDNNKSILDIQTKFQKSLTDYINSRDFYKNYQLSEESLAELKYIVDKCSKNQIELTVFISPLHASHLEVIRAAGLWSIFEQWKTEITNITQTWDFADYHSIATELIREDMVYFTDSIHYTPLTGNLILDKMLSKTPSYKYNNFGSLIDSNNVEEKLIQVRDNRKKWVQNNPELYNWIKSFLY